MDENMVFLRSLPNIHFSTEFQEIPFEALPKILLWDIF
jgi:hypothetical protein